MDVISQSTRTQLSVCNLPSKQHMKQTYAHTNLNIKWRVSMEVHHIVMGSVDSYKRHMVDSCQKERATII